MIDYAENLCEAMKIIFEKQIKQLSFDITIDATVIDATNAKNGMYTVSHDGATFIAYSTDTSFKEKDVVMVTVPQGNYDNQKMIIGKQVDKDKEKKPITYQSPFSQITNLSGNLVYGNIGEKGLLANGGIGKSENEQASAQIILIKELKSSDNTLSEEYQSNGYTRIGLRADFSTWLNEFNVVSGNYGLILTLKFKNPDITDPEENSTITAIYVFDSSEFFGDIYNFETYYNQEAIFDISDYSNYPIQSITLEAYQKDNFKVSNGSDLSYENEFFDNSFKPSDNIFIKDPFICLGTAIGEFKKDTANIMTTSASIYNNSDNPNNDIKDLKLKWTHQDLNSKDIYVVQNDSIPANYEIRWYKFKLGEKSPDEFMDAHWIRLYCKKEEESNYYYLEENNNQINNINKINVKFQPDRNNQTEQIRVVILRKNENNNNALFVAQTPIITFNNNQQILPDIEYIDANALGIQFNDTEKGKYYYYDKTGKKMSSKEKNPEHILKAVFDNNTNLENKGDLTDQTYTSIKWIFPKNNTMIIPIFPNYDSKTITIGDKNYSTIYTREDEDSDDNYEFLFQNTEGEKSILETMTYKIDDNFSFNKSRNTVYLEVVVNGQTYISSVTMFFGIAGTSGSDYTIVVEWSAGIPVFDINKDNETLTGTVKLLDLNFEEVVLNSDATYNYNLKYNLNEGLTCQPKNNSPNQSNFTISKNNNNISINDLYILEIKLTNFGNYNLITNYPIALKNTIKDENEKELVKINGITGATMVRYASDGTITPNNNDPYSISFQIKENNNFVLANDKYKGFWQIIPTKNNNNKNFLPELVDIDNTVEAFILELSKIPYPNNDSETTLLDVLLYIIPKENEGYSDNNRLSSLVLSINNINKPYTSPPFEEGQQKETNNNFKNFLSRIEKQQLNNLFSTLEKKFGEDYFSTFFLSKKINPILSPPSIYLKDTPLYGVQYIYSPDGINNQILYTQPIYVYQDNYPSTTINQWNGKDLILNENNGTIIANGFSAGKKEDNNTFTGVMIGNWSRTEAEDSSITTNTGIYGFHQGAMSYAFTDDGTAFIGKDGGGRIEFDGNNGIIKSAGFIPSTENQHGYGTLIDLNEGKLQLYSPISIQDKNKVDQTDYYLTLSSEGTQEQPFLQISRKRNEVENFISKYLNQYYNAYEDLKNYTTEVYDQLIKFAQAYITYKTYDNTISTPDNEMSELIPYTYYIMKNFEKNSEIDIKSLNSLGKFPELEDGVSIDNGNVWKFFYDSSERNTLIDYEKNQYQTLLQNFYNDPTLSNLSTVNIFIKTYIDKYEINQYVQDSNIINYFFEDVSQLLSDDSEMSNNNYDKYTQQKKLIKFIFNNSQEPLTLGEKTGLTYYLYNFINFIPIFSSRSSVIKSTQDSLEIIQANINALNSMWTENQVEFFIKDPLSTDDDIRYIPVNKNEVYKCYHIQNGNIKYFSNEYWSNASGNNYKMDKDGISTQISSESNFPVYYIQLNNKHIKFNYYYSTFTPVNNTINSENSISNPILTFEKNKIYYYKSNNNDSDEYIPTNYCDNNNEYFYTIYNSPNMNDFKNISFFSTNINYYELTSSYQLNYDYDQEPYQKYQFDFVSLVEENDNLTETYILKSFILPTDTDQVVEREFKAGNGRSSLFEDDQYRSSDYTKVKIYTNQIYDITLRIDTKPQSSLGLTKDLWPIQGGFSVTEDGTTTPYYTSLSFTLRKNVFGKDLLDSLIQDKYSFLNVKNQKYLKLIGPSRLIKQGMYIQQIEEKINILNAALRNVLRSVPLARQSEYKEDFSIKYLREISSTSKKSITLSLLTTNTIKMEELKEYLKKDISNNFIFDVTSWENDLIKIMNDGGYITSKDYRPTIISGDKVARTPIQSQDSSSSEWRQGMKGFIIDLSNNKIVLGNNSQIEGVQTQYYPGQTDVPHRYFIISTGAKFKSGQGIYSDRDILTEKSASVKTYFIRAQADWSSSEPSKDIFYVRWDGYVYCLGLRVQDNFYFGSHKVSSGPWNNLPSGAQVLYYR